jgi:hypothetical protein
MDENTINQYRKDYGYYVYKDKIYDTKQEILKALEIFPDFSPDVNFNFSDNVFQKIDWTYEPEFSLDALYKIRAQQLRENFDYLVLMYSGGVDSHQVLNTFMKNNIHLDEIRSSFQSSLANQYKFNSDPHDPYGLLNEYISLLPWFKKIKNTIPNTKLVIYDYTDDLKSLNLDNFITDFYFNYATHTKLIYSQMRLYLHTKKMIQDLQHLSNKKVAVIYGSDKPFYTIMNNKLFGFFTDTGRGGHAEALKYEAFQNPPYVPKMFFWTSDCPLIPVKQLHVIKKAAQLNEKFKKMIHTTNAFQMREQTVFKRLLYPDYDSSIYQCASRPNEGEKIYSSLFPEISLTGIMQEKNKTVKQMQSKLQTNNIQSKYGISIRSKYYYVGEI